MLMRNFHNAAGQKVRKTVDNNDGLKIVDYLDGFQYAGSVLQFFPTAEGYVKATRLDKSQTELSFNYIYNYTDHLGNVRLSYTLDPQEGTLKIVDENHYYPFGLRHEIHYPSSRIRDFRAAEGLNGGQVGEPVELVNVTKTAYQYKYNGKEWQDELGLNWLNYGWRNYMPDLGRWATPDPLLNDLTTTIDFDQENEDDDEIDMIEAFAAKMEVGGGVYNPYNLNPYGYGYNNPISYDDPDGRCPSCIGALLGAATDYGLQVAGNLIEGKSLGQ